MDRKMLLALVVVPAVLVAIASVLPVNPGVTATEKPVIKSRVCISKNNELIECKSNVITNNGKDLLKTALGQGAYIVVNHLALGNTSAPAATSTSHPGLISDCGLASADGTYYSEGTGNWTIGKTWTCTCAGGIVVNTTGLYNDTNTGTYFAGTSFTSTTLQQNDQISVNYTIWIS
jgi:hypothetical protein